MNQVVAENGHASVLEFFLLTFERAGYGKSSDVLESLLHTYTFSLNSILFFLVLHQICPIPSEIVQI